MQQTPVHDQHNPDLLKFIPAESNRIVEVGCSSGALAREFKRMSPGCHWTGVEIDAAYAELARRYCDECLVMDIEAADDAFWHAHAEAECWIFGDTLEHFKDPWAILRRIRNRMPANASIVACIPNAQHWSLQVRLSVGDFRYESQGLLDRTHLRWFTRQTILEMFHQCGFEIQAGMPRIFNEPRREAFLPVISEMARLAGVEPKIARDDALPLQYVVRAVPRIADVQ